MTFLETTSREITESRTSDPHNASFRLEEKQQHTLSSALGGALPTII